MSFKSNTSNDISKPEEAGVIKSRKHHETRLMRARETPRERMVRVVQSVQQKRKQRGA